MYRLFLLVIALILGNSACARHETCSQHFAEGDAPQFTNQKLAAKSTLLCYEAYAVMHSGISRTPLWSAEHLTAERVAESRKMKRQNAFHPEDRLPHADRAELVDYAHSGFDRGHMSPSGDMPTANAQYESFSLANIIPQDPNNNQQLWASIEESTRNLAHDDGELYVITGPLFEGTSLQRLNGRVLVPTHVFKAIYDPARHAAAAYLAENARGREYHVISIAELEQKVGVRLFPHLDANIRESRMELPEPQVHGRARSKRDSP